MTQEPREKLKRWTNKILGKLWFAVYGLPIGYGWYYLFLNMMLGFTISRDAFPEGMIIGVIWFIINGLIWILIGLICTMFAFVLFGLIWTIEKQIVTKVMSPGIRRTLNLVNYKNIFDNRFRKQKSNN